MSPCVIGAGVVVCAGGRAALWREGFVLCEVQERLEKGNDIKQSWERRAGRRVGRGFPDTGFPRAEAGEVKDGGAFGRLQAL